MAMANLLDDHRITVNGIQTDIFLQRMEYTSFGGMAKLFAISTYLPDVFMNYDDIVLTDQILVGSSFSLSFHGTYEGIFRLSLLDVAPANYAYVFEGEVRIVAKAPERLEIHQDRWDLVD